MNEILASARTLSSGVGTLADVRNLLHLYRHTLKGTRPLDEELKAIGSTAERRELKKYLVRIAADPKQPDEVHLVSSGLLIRLFADEIFADSRHVRELLLSERVVRSKTARDDLAKLVAAATASSGVRYQQLGERLKQLASKARHDQTRLYAAWLFWIGWECDAETISVLDSLRCNASDPANRGRAAGCLLAARILDASPMTESAVHGLIEHASDDAEATRDVAISVSIQLLNWCFIEDFQLAAWLPTLARWLVDSRDGLVVAAAAVLLSMTKGTAANRSPTAVLDRAVGRDVLQPATGDGEAELRRHVGRLYCLFLAYLRDGKERRRYLERLQFPAEATLDSAVETWLRIEGRNPAVVRAVYEFVWYLAAGGVQTIRTSCFSAAGCIRILSLLESWDQVRQQERESARAEIQEVCRLARERVNAWLAHLEGYRPKDIEDSRKFVAEIMAMVWAAQAGNLHLGRDRVMLRAAYGKGSITPSFQIKKYVGNQTQHVASYKELPLLQVLSDDGENEPAPT